MADALEGFPEAMTSMFPKAADTDLAVFLMSMAEKARASTWNEDWED